VIVTVAAAKMNAPALELFARAILCNWLVWPGDLDLGADDQRRRQVHRHLLVPLRVHRQRL